MQLFRIVLTHLCLLRLRYSKLAHMQLALEATARGSHPAPGRARQAEMAIDDVQGDRGPG